MSLATKELRVAVKKHAKETLHRDLGGNIGLNAVVLLLAGGSAAISQRTNSTADAGVIIGIALLAFVFSIVLGLISAYANFVSMYQSVIQMRDETARAEPVNSWFKTYLTWPWMKRMIQSAWFPVLYVLGWIIGISVSYVFIGVGVGLMAVAGVTGNEIPGTVWTTFLLGLIGVIAFTITLTMKEYKYLLVPFIAFDRTVRGEKPRGAELIAESSKLMMGHRWELFVFFLSFFWWFMLSAVTFGLALFYVRPYIVLSFAGFYETLRSDEVVEPAVVVEVLQPRA
jgi:uncharacterized membrane protein